MAIVAMGSHNRSKSPANTWGPSNGINSLLTHLKRKQRLNESSGTWAVVYAYPVTGPVVIKGSVQSVRRRFIELSVCHGNYVVYSNKRKVSTWLINRPGWYIVKQRKKQKWTFRFNGVELFKVRTMPKRYIRDFDKTDKFMIIHQLWNETKHAP